MFKNKKAQLIALTFSESVQFLFVLLVIIGLVVAGGILFSSRGLSKNSIYFKEEKFKVINNLETQDTLIRFLESPFNKSLLVRDKIIESVLTEERNLDTSAKEKMNKILGNLTGNDEFYEIEIEASGRQEEISSHNDINFLDDTNVYTESISSVFLFSDKKIKVTLILKK